MTTAEREPDRDHPAHQPGRPDEDEKPEHPITDPPRPGRPHPEHPITDPPRTEPKDA
jgi:hypothetical protein